MDDPQCVKMPFGKYKGEFLGDIPRDYLKWCVLNLENLDSKLEKAMVRTIKMMVE